jgi:hypothetical protein
MSIFLPALLTTFLPDPAGGSGVWQQVRPGGSGRPGTMRPSSSASETLFSAVIVLWWDRLRLRSKLRFAQGRHPSRRDVAIHLRPPICAIGKPEVSSSLCLSILSKNNGFDGAKPSVAPFQTAKRRSATFRFPQDRPWLFWQKGVYRFYDSHSARHSDYLADERS